MAKKPVRTRKRVTDKSKAWEPTPRQLEMYHAVCQGQTYREVAQKYKVTFQNVHYAVQRISSWLAPQLVDSIRQIKAEHTTSLMHIFRQSMEAWERSKLDAVTIKEIAVSSDKNSEGVEVERTTKGQAGDSKFLSEARAALYQVREIWGANSPIRVEHSDAERVAGRSLDEVRAEVAKKLEQLGQRLAPKVN